MDETPTRDAEVIAKLRDCPAEELATTLNGLAIDLLPGNKHYNIGNSPGLIRFLSRTVLSGVEGETSDSHREYSNGALNCLKAICAKNSMASGAVLELAASYATRAPTTVEEVRAQQLTRAIIDVCPAVIVPQYEPYGNTTPNALGIAQAGVNSATPEVCVEAVKTARACMIARPETAPELSALFSELAVEHKAPIVRAAALDALTVAAYKERGLEGLVGMLGALDSMATEDPDPACRMAAKTTAATIREVHPNADQMMGIEFDRDRRDEEEEHE